MRIATGLFALSLTLSACATTGSAPNGWAATRPARSAPERARPVRPQPPAPARERPPVAAERMDREPAPPVRAVSASSFVIPVAGFDPDRLRDTFDSPRSGGRVHQAIDLPAPTGTPLLAVTDGVVTRKHWNRLGGNTLYLSSADGRYDFYYAHLDAYEDGVEIGTRVRRGDRLGTVGATGNAQGAHLHFQVLDKRGGGRGTPVNPYGLLRRADLAQVNGAAD